MFSNGRKTIGLFIFNPQGDFQEKICQAVAVRAEELGYNLAVFSSYGAYGTEGSGYETGQMMIYELPDYSKLAGIVLVIDTFSISWAKDRIMEHIEKEASCPVVSLRVKVEGVNNILLDESISMDKLTRHIIEDHGKKDIAFMTGWEDRIDAQERLDCFRKVMGEYGYPVGDHRFFYGDFWKAKGKEACDWFCTDGNYPEAVICANDYMALAVIDELFERGIRVPEDVLVTGYDGLNEGAYYYPSLTTGQIDFMEMGQTAVDLIDRHQNDSEVEDVYLSPKLIKRASCVCQDINDITAVAQKCALHRSVSDRDNLEMQLSFMTIDLSGVKEIKDLHGVISKYIYNMQNFRDYYMCFRDDIDEKKDTFPGYTDQMLVRVALKNRENMGEVSIPFDRHMLLPAELVDDTPQCCFFFPIHYREASYGYEVYSFDGKERYGKTSVRWNISVSNAVYNINTYNRMNDLIFELENMYIQDALTGLYNRRGFEKYARMQFSQARAKDKMVCVIGIDMDGLKPINDIYGHHEGDSALRVVGYAIQEAVVPGQIGARIGGDEFEVFFPCESEKQVRQWIDTFEHSLDTYNKKSEKCYEVHASLGYRSGIPTANDTIASYMKESDDLMYKNKIENKRRRNEALR